MCSLSLCFLCAGFEIPKMYGFYIHACIDGTAVSDRKVAARCMWCDTSTLRYCGLHSNALRTPSVPQPVGTQGFASRLNKLRYTADL